MFFSGGFMSDVSNWITMRVFITALNNSSLNENFR